MAHNQKSHQLNQEQSVPDVNCQVIVQKEGEMKIPDRSLQVSQQQINIFVRRDNIIDANLHPELIKEYVEPPPNHIRKIVFAICNIIVLVAYFPRQGYTQKQRQLVNLVMFRYFMFSSITIVVNLIFYFLVKPQRIIKYADYFLLLNVNKTNPCLNIILGYLLSDFGVFMTFIAFVFLIINSIKICRQNMQDKRKREEYERKPNKLMTDISNTQYSELFENSSATKKQGQKSSEGVQMK